ncbi:ArsR family transcriptional regulator [Thermogymnomonas acidicola]|uniref:helix-turn-helix transcriptional regulator n=1 Tax=Thermogymnomonas acidicola TaxID=399579 RepID=UPI0009462059|nr:ArsR family transcriptional regulator [Thermogymnomonas acidicola]
MKAEILRELSTSERSAGSLSELLGINKTAVKEHLETLEKKGYIRSYFKHQSSGRPGKFYELTEKGMELFPKRYAEFSALLLQEVERELGGQERLNAILSRMADRLVESVGWSGNLDEGGTTREGKIRKLGEFVSMLNRLGYYARLEIGEDCVRIVRHNCIFYELAKASNRFICSSLEREVISKGLSSKARISETFSDGGKRCVVEIDL